VFRVVITELSSDEMGRLAELDPQRATDPDPNAFGG
jgi:hypothetical protein